MRKQPNRRRSRNRAFGDMKQRLIDTLNKLAEGLTPPEMVTAHVDFYETCTDTEQEILFKIFRQEEPALMNKILYFFEEKRNA